MMNKAVEQTHNPLDDGMSHINQGKKCGTYAIIHIPSGAVYYGSSSDMDERKHVHNSLLRNNKHHNSELQRLYAANPEVLYEFFPCESREEAYQMEEALIKDTPPPLKCINVATDVRHPTRGRECSSQRRDALSKTHAGRVIDDAWKVKLSDAAKNRVYGEGEHEKRVAAVKDTLGAKISVGGVVYASSRDAAKAHGISSATVMRWVRSNDDKHSDWKLIEVEEVVMSAKQDHNPLDDGITHVNVYTKGRTRLGRLLTNLADVPVNHPTYGMFRTAEGLWYYLKTGCKHESLRALSGFEAKKLGNTLEVVWNQDFKEQFLIGVKAKVMDNPEIVELLKGSSMPFAHYYFFGSPYADNPPKVVYPRDSEWQMEFFEELRKELQSAA